MQYKIPQNVQAEDRIIGPITMKQLLVLGVGGGISYVLYTALAKSYYWEIWLPPVGILGLLTIALAFIKINDIPFLKYVLLVIEYFMRPQKRVWAKSSYSLIIPLTLASGKTPPNSNLNKTAEHQLDKNITQLEKLSRMLDSNKFKNVKIKLDDNLENTNDDNLVRQAFLGENHDIKAHTNRLKKLARNLDTKKIERLKTTIGDKNNVHGYTEKKTNNTEKDQTDLSLFRKRLGKKNSKLENPFAPPKNIFENRTNLSKHSSSSRISSPDTAARKRNQPVRKNTHINNLKPLNKYQPKKIIQPKERSLPPKNHNTPNSSHISNIKGTIDFGNLKNRSNNTDK